MGLLLPSLPRRVLSLTVAVLFRDLALFLLPCQGGTLLTSFQIPGTVDLFPSTQEISALLCPFPPEALDMLHLAPSGFASWSSRLPFAEAFLQRP